MWCCEGDSITLHGSGACVCNTRVVGGGGQGAAYDPLGGGHPQSNSAFTIVSLRATPVDDVKIGMHPPEDWLAHFRRSEAP